MKIRIHITKEVLEKTKMCGVKSTWKISANCAIAYAIRDIFPEAEVNGTCCLVIRFDLQGNSQDYSIYVEGKLIPLPDVACYFIEQFDQLEPSERVKMDPISFDIDVPDSIIKKIGIEEATRILSSSKTLELI